MSDDTTADEYIAEYLDGPLEGQYVARSYVDDKPESRVSVIAAVEGLESIFWYDAVDERRVGDQLHVRFRFDAGDSDPVEPDDEND